MMNEQQQLMTAILKADCSFDIDEKGLAVYKRNLHANAMRALEISFPTVEQLLGAELFAYCVEQLLLTSPPGSGDWGTWGREFSALLSQLPALDDYPYVADMATLDYSLHVLNRAKDFSVELSSMSLLASHDLDHLRVVLNPAINLLVSDYPILDIYQANHMNAMKYLTRAKLKMAEGIGQQVLVYRPQFKAKVREHSIEEQYWFELISEGLSIGHALEKMSSQFHHNDSAFLFEEWLPKAIQENTISCIETI